VINKMFMQHLRLSLSSFFLLYRSWVVFPTIYPTNVDKLKLINFVNYNIIDFQAYHVRNSQVKKLAVLKHLLPATKVCIIK
jgi:hypothetical protein